MSTTCSRPLAGGALLVLCFHWIRLLGKTDETEPGAEPNQASQARSFSTPTTNLSAVAPSSHPPSSAALLLYFRISQAFFSRLQIPYWLEFSSALAVHRYQNTSKSSNLQNSSTASHLNSGQCALLVPPLLPGELDVDFGFLVRDVEAVKAALSDAHILRDVGLAVAANLTSECEGEADAEMSWKQMASKVGFYDSSRNHLFAKMGLQGLGANCDWYSYRPYQLEFEYEDETLMDGGDSDWHPDKMVGPNANQANQPDRNEAQSGSQTGDEKEPLYELCLGSWACSSQDCLPVPEQLLFPTLPCSLLGVETQCPHRLHDYLSFRYGYLGPNATKDRTTGHYFPAVV